LAALLLVPLLALLAAALGGQLALEEISRVGNARAELYRAYLVGLLERPAGVPLALAYDPLVLDAVEGDAAARKRLNGKLATLAEAAGISDLYVMDGQGTTVAANNWNREVSFLGRNFAFRSYFTTAMRGETGRAFALGTTSRQPGYYVAQPVRRGQAVVGAVVAKVVLDRLEDIPADTPERVLVTDPDGVVFLTHTPAWRFHSLETLSPERLADIEADQRYPGITIQPLPGRLADGQAVLEEDGTVYRYLVRSLELPGGGWHLHVLLETGTTAVRALSWGAAGGFGALALMLAGAMLAHRRSAAAAERLRSLLEREELERRIRERTAELVQAAKLATIGQMAAGIVHEVNQPLAAIRAFADNAVQFLDRGCEDRARTNLGEIAALVDRLAGITRSLKGFARRPGDQLDTVRLDVAVDKALALVGQRLRAQRVTVSANVAGIAVRAEDVRLQQVLVNLIANSLDALEGRPSPLLSVAAHEEGEAVVVEVADNGVGIPDAVLPKLFDPFFTTKEVGEGLGLGLPIASAIVRDFGGILTAGNQPGGGARFVLTLVRAEAT
jgi:two-component system C4-dicarboxylate transport sensor histidine kinase DctB